MKGAVAKRLLESIGGAAASARFKGGIESLDLEESKLRAEIVAAEGALEEAVGLGEDTAALAEKIVAAQAKLLALPLRRKPLQKHLDEATAAAAAKSEAERLARRAIRLQEKRERGRILHDEAVDHLYAGMMALTRLDVVEREAMLLSDRMGVGDCGLLFDADPSSIAATAMARVLGDLPPWVANARFGAGAVDAYALALVVYRRVFEPERFLES